MMLYSAKTVVEYSQMKLILFLKRQGVRKKIYLSRIFNPELIFAQGTTVPLTQVTHLEQASNVNPHCNHNFGLRT